MRYGLHNYLQENQKPNKFWYYFRIEHPVEIWHAYVFEETAEKARNRLHVYDPVWRYPKLLEYCGSVSEEVVKKWITPENNWNFKQGFVVRMEYKNVSKSKKK